MRRLALALALASTLAPAAARADAPPPAPRLREWTFVYYMAYDNNLEKCGRPILDMLGKGVTSDDVVVTCLADFTDEGLKRYVLTRGAEDVEAVPGDSSAEEETVRDYLAWVKATHPAKRYALVFLDHGGRLGQMSNDDNPREGGQEWLEVVETGKTVAEWRRGLPATSSVELLFLQQCGKGTLENYHAFKDAAAVLMGSQTVVGAPNSYYTKSIAAVCERPDVDGAEVARLMRENDPPNMFTTYTTVRSSALGELVARLEPVLAPLAAKDALDLPRGLTPCFDQPPDEAFFDGLPLLAGLYEANGLDRAPLDAFAAWARESLIAGHRVSERQRQRAGTWCGFSLLLPLSKDAYARYKHYPLWAETQLDEVLEKAVRTAAAKAQERRRAREGRSGGEPAPGGK